MINNENSPRFQQILDAILAAQKAEIEHAERTDAARTGADFQMLAFERQQRALEAAVKKMPKSKKRSRK